MCHDVRLRGLFTRVRRSSILGREVKPELLAVAEEGATATDSAEVRVVDLRESDPQGPRPEEILALQFEYYNMTDYEGFTTCTPRRARIGSQNRCSCPSRKRQNSRVIIPLSRVIRSRRSRSRATAPQYKS